MAISDRVDSGPKYKHIYNKLLEALKNGGYEVGSKLPSENELVEQFGASRPTVGRALAQLETDGLIERRAGSGTFVRVPDRQEGFIFGLLIPELGATEIFEPICRGISMARIGGHHDLLWGPTFSPGASEEFQAEELCQYYIRRGVTGVFFAPMELMGKKDEVNRRITAALDEAQIPIVLLDRDICEFPYRSRYDLVGIDNRRAGFIITEHVLDTGARRIAFFGRPNSAPTVKARAMGYSDAIRNRRELKLEEWIEMGDPTDIPTVRNLVERIRPDAVVCANDYTAGQLMTSLNSLGLRVPSEIKVTGMDDIRYAKILQTPLTTIHQPCLDLGAAALGAMLDRASHPQMPARDFIVDFKLVVRESTGH
jgi:DNA-binding LacI/PurR family transcriptional regulator/DNA-binding transcriptional regulator YhcF (GntR family)